MMKICVQLAIITNTSVEFYSKMNFSEITTMINTVADVYKKRKQK